MPGSFDESLMTEWSLWVLDNGLPHLPNEVAVGCSVPVAHWIGPRFGAVMHLQWSWSEHHGSDMFGSEIELFHRLGQDWEVADGGGGSSGGIDARLDRVAVPAGFAAIRGTTSFVGDRWSCTAVDGVTGRSARWVRLEDSDGVTVRSLDSPLGFLLVATEAGSEACVVVTDADGGEMLRHRFGPDSLAERE
jgi:hypothetical protein